MLGGRSPFTWYPQSYVDQVAMTNMNMRPNMTSNFPGRTYRFYKGPTLYPFGHGLSYSSFSPFIASAPSTILIHNATSSPPKKFDLVEDQPPLDTSSINCLDLTFLIVVGVKNNGPRDGSNVVLVFWSPPTSNWVSGVPMTQLIGFERVEVRVGKTEYVNVKVNVCEGMSVVDEDGKRKVVIGKHTILVGSSSETQVKFQIDVKLEGSGNGSGEEDMKNVV